MATNSGQELTGANNSGNINYFNTAMMREHMFDKVVTPSDVGKLNRLVIPKQHAENYFPLEDNQNGTVLDFQDRNGKMWRFRYSYWNSSQSYVMTKGWSRFVKEKKLDAGDTVSFHRGYVPIAEADDNELADRRRKVMFIDWRHRAEINILPQHHPYPLFRSFSSSSYIPMMPEYSMSQYRSNFSPFCYNNQREVLGYGNYGRVISEEGRFRNLTSEVRRSTPVDHYHQWNLGRSEPLVYDSYPVFPLTRVNPSALSQMMIPEKASTAKKLRLFGVDVEESSSSGETRGGMGFGGTSSSPVVIRDDDHHQSYWRSPPRGEMGASSSSIMELSDDDDQEYKRKGKFIQ